jgi:hypothetical protein
MKIRAILLVALAVSTLVRAQSPLPSVDLADPSTLVSEPTCVSECEAVYADCRAQCGEKTVRARDEHLELNSGGQDRCLQRCRSDVALCKQTCGGNQGE